MTRNAIGSAARDVLHNIIEDIRSGAYDEAEEPLSSFSMLHDYTDANWYLEDLFLAEEPDDRLLFVNAVSDLVDDFLHRHPLRVPAALVTYHGITRIRCRSCEYDTTDRTTMETWNDYGDGCPQCSSVENVFYLQDGSVHGTSLDDDGSTLVYIITRAPDPQETRA